MHSLCMQKSCKSSYAAESLSSAYQEVIQIGKHLGQANLKHLDLRWTKAAFSVGSTDWSWFNEGRVFCLPDGLKDLALPADIAVPKLMAEQINSLTGLTYLECSSTGFWPSAKLISLQHLCIASKSRGPIIMALSNADHDWRTEFFVSTLERLTNLTGLDLHLNSGQIALNMPPTIKDLTVNVATRVAGRMMPSASLLAPLTGLTSLKLSQDSTHDRAFFAIDLSAAPFDHLRNLALAGFGSSFPVMTAPQLTSLTLQGFGVHNKLNWLQAASIARAYTLTSIKKLEISNWHVRSSLKSLASLPHLTHLRADQGLQLLIDVLRPGCLGSLETVTLFVSNADGRLRGEWRVAALRDGLLDLPRLRLLSLSVNPYCADRILHFVLAALGTLEGDEWQRLCSREEARLYERVRSARD